MPQIAEAKRAGRLSLCDRRPARCFKLSKNSYSTVTGSII